MRFAALTLAALFLTGGCAHYQLGTQGKLDFSTLYLAPVKVKPLLPEFGAPVSTILRETFNNDGRVTLVNSPEEADATLTVVIATYHRDVAAAREQDTGLASKFSIAVTALCTLKNNRTGRDYFTDRPIISRRDVFTDNGNPHSSLVGDQLQAEYNIVPIFGEDLGSKIAHSVLDVW